MDMRQKGYALKTEKTYLYWIKYFIVFHKKQHPQSLGNRNTAVFILPSEQSARSNKYAKNCFECTGIFI